MRIGKRRVPFKSQTSSLDCGAACLAMILGYLDIKVSVREIVALSDIGRHGISAAKLAEAAAQFGVGLTARTLDLCDLQTTRRPTILHWKFMHWVVCETCGPKHAIIVDPQSGRRRCDLSEVSSCFTGLALIPEKIVRAPAPACCRGVVTSFKAVAQLINGISGWMLGTVFLALLLFATCGQLLGVGLALLLGRMFRVLSSGLDHRLALTLFIGSLGLLIGKVTFAETRALVLAACRAKLDSTAIRRLFERLLRLQYIVAVSRGAGELSSRMESYALLRHAITDRFVGSITDMTCCAVYFIGLCIVSRAGAAIAAAAAGLSIILILVKASVERELWLCEREAESERTNVIQDILRGSASIKTLGCAAESAATIQSVANRQMNANFARTCRTAFWRSGSLALLELVPYCLVCQAIMTASYRGSADVGRVVTELFLAAGFLSPFGMIVETAGEMKAAKASWDRVEDIVVMPVEREGGQSANVNSTIELNELTYAYPGERRHVLDRVCCTFLPGKLTAVVGASGCGKTTLIALLLGLIEPTSGEILYAGTLLSQINLEDLRRKTGSVLQDESLFSTTVCENILLGRPDASLAEVVQAAKIAGIHGDIVEMAAGYETFIFENGRSLSGGQRQRIALARSLVKKPALLILDEAASNLDCASVSRIDDALAEMRCTRIVVSHRLSSVINADNIIVLNKGKVEEQGTHRELVANRGTYYDLFAAQIVELEVQLVGSANG